jgi:hypothetical protein
LKKEQNAKKWQESKAITLAFRPFLATFIYKTETKTDKKVRL